MIQDNDKPLAVLLKYEHFLAMQEMIGDEEKIDLLVLRSFTHDSGSSLA